MLIETVRMRGYFQLLCFTTCAGLLLRTPLATAAAEKKPDYNKKMQLGQLLYFNGNVDRAINAFKVAAQVKPDAFEPHLNLVNIYVQKQDFSSAIEECREGLKIKPTHRDLHLILGNLLRTVAGSKDPEEAKKLLEEAKKELSAAEDLGANKGLVNSTQAVINVQTGDFAKAMEHVKIALEENPKNADAHLIKAVLHHKETQDPAKPDAHKKEHRDLTMHHLDQAIKHKGKNAEARNTKADILYSQQKVDEALAEYKRALEDDPKYHQSRMGIANILISQQKWEEALTHLEKAAEVKPDDANILYSIAICLEKLGKVELAIPKFNEGMMVDNNVQTKNQILMHVRELQQKGFLNVPGLMSPGGAPFGAVPAGPGSGLFGANSALFGESMKDLIKIKPPAGESGSKEK